ncbi:MAG: hypothetical protein ETSY2_52280 [Candidatus Entotheonella gemina]|uniref:Uncharacterized protein n=1 Tax=Candidatus Entotheonella gemina TaxID=1429439 RepID=W4L4B7_9BACT|nr:MAG: hypothetical protein ETSY2_52280 [Candidatus Entotheonella gemina]
MASDWESDFPAEYQTELIRLRQELTVLIHRGQQAGLPPALTAMAVAEAGCQALGHAIGDMPPPEGPELLQELTRQLQQAAESCYFRYWS